MQITIYVQDRDEYLIEKVERDAEAKRMSKSAVILSILERHFERGKDPLQILLDCGKLKEENIPENAGEINEDELVERLPIKEGCYEWAKELSKK